MSPDSRSLRKPMVSRMLRFSTRKRQRSKPKLMTFTTETVTVDQMIPAIAPTWAPLGRKKVTANPYPTKTRGSRTNAKIIGQVIGEAFDSSRSGAFM